MDEEKSEDYMGKDSEDEEEESSFIKEGKTEKRIDNEPDKIGISNVAKKFKKNPWVIVSFLLAVIVIVLLIINYRGGISGNVISGEDAGNKVVEYLNSKTGGGVEYISYGDKGDLYEVLVAYKGDNIPVYVTKDGEYFVQGAIPITGNAVDDTSSQTQLTEVPKTDKPVIELFVMSFCPYGNKAEETMLPVYNLLKDKVDWNINYIVSVSGDKISSLHGQPEVDQDIREVCVKKEYGLDKFWNFVSYINNNCGSDGSCWETGAKQLGIDTKKIQTCFDNEGLTLMKAESKISNDAGANGSPTFLINGVQSNAIYQYGNSESYKQAICSAFNTAPEECNILLTSSSSTTASSVAQC